MDDHHRTPLTRRMAKAVGGLGFGMYVAVDFALVVDVLPDQDRVAKDLGVLNVASALPLTRAQARLEVFDYIEGFYNSERRHSGLRRPAGGMLSPAAFERQWLLAQTASVLRNEYDS